MLCSPINAMRLSGLDFKQLKFNYYYYCSGPNLTRTGVRRTVGLITHEKCNMATIELILCICDQYNSGQETHFRMSDAT